MIHRTAIIHPKTDLGSDVEVGPYSILGENVKIRDGTKISSHVVINGWTEIGKNCQIFPFASLGEIPQDLKFKGEKSYLIIGSGNTIREYVTINRGTEGGGGKTVIGDNNLLMAYVHVAHDCILGNNLVLANAVTLAGHIEIEDYAMLGGLVGVHQFVRVGRNAFVAGLSAVTQDIPPYMLAFGNRAQLYGLNKEGLRRSNFSEETIEKLKRAYRTLFRSNIPLKEALEIVKKEIPNSSEVMYLLNFIEKSKRGVCKASNE